MASMVERTPLGRSDADSHHGRPVNVGEMERWLSLLGGGSLIACGLRSDAWARWLGLAAGAALVYRGWTGHCDAYGALGLNTAVEHHDRIGVKAQHGVKIVRSIHVNRDRQELYDYWRKLENLPKVMRHLESVTTLDGKRSHWKARSPIGQTLEWDAEVITDQPGELIGWRSLPDSEVDTAGSVHFKQPLSGKGTEITVSLKYDPPGGKPVAQLAELLGVGLEHELSEDLRTFKQTMEAGEMSTAAARPAQ